MFLDVQRQVVAAGEAAVAELALERLGARVLPVVTRQLIRPGEAPLAARPRALVRLLACNHTHMTSLSHHDYTYTIHSVCLPDCCDHFECAKRVCQRL